jgi:hypothetical protein
LVSSYFKFHHDVCSRWVIIAVYMNVCTFNSTGKEVRSTWGFLRNWYPVINVLIKQSIRASFRLICLTIESSAAHHLTQ